MGLRDIIPQLSSADYSTSGILLSGVIRKINEMADSWVKPTLVPVLVSVFVGAGSSLYAGQLALLELKGAITQVNTKMINLEGQLKTAEEELRAIREWRIRQEVAAEFSRQHIIPNSRDRR